MKNTPKGRWQLPPTFYHTITIFNKVKGEDNPSKKDVWYKTILSGCSYQSKTISTANGSTLSIAKEMIVRIPKNERYKTYRLYVENPTVFFTFSLGDIVILGSTQEQTIASASEILNKYPNSFSIKNISDNTSISAVGQHYCLRG